MLKLFRFVKICHELFWLYLIVKVLADAIRAAIAKKTPKPANKQKALFEAGTPIRQTPEAPRYTQSATPVCTCSIGKDLLVNSFSPSEREMFMQAEARTSSARELTMESQKQLDKVMSMFEKQEAENILSDKDF